MLNIVIPMAGRGSRFADAGYCLPKPLIPVRGVPMIRLVINNLRPQRQHKFIFLCLQDHIDEFNIDLLLKKWSPDCVVVPVYHVTEGAACTVLLAKNLFNNENPLMIANSDQWVSLNINDYLISMDKKNVDGWIMTMTANDPKWSYIQFDEHVKIGSVVEKKVVSSEATVGIYNYKRGKDFVDAAEQMIEEGLKVKGEYYVAPAYNQMIKKKQDIGFFNIGDEANGMYGLGIPDDLKLFESQNISLNAVKGLI
jgi:dTDP-glucose pyrophosphorylase